MPISVTVIAKIDNGSANYANLEFNKIKILANIVSSYLQQNAICTLKYITNVLFFILNQYIRCKIIKFNYPPQRAVISLTLTRSCSNK